MGSLPVAVHIYDGQGGDESIVDRATNAANILIPSTAVAFVLFIFMIEKEYRKTFYSLKKGKELTMSGFKNAESDSIRAYFAFTNSRHHWVEIEDEVKAWVEANWARWQEEKPKWLDANIRSNIPENFIPEGYGKIKPPKRSRILKSSSSLKPGKRVKVVPVVTGDTVRDSLVEEHVDDVRLK